jgi:hypothetical protein
VIKLISYAFELFQRSDNMEKDFNRDRTPCKRAIYLSQSYVLNWESETFFQDETFSAGLAALFYLHFLQL